MPGNKPPILPQVPAASGRGYKGCSARTLSCKGWVRQKDISGWGAGHWRAWKRWEWGEMWPGKLQWQTTSLPLKQYWEFSLPLSYSPKPPWFYLCVARGRVLNKARLQCTNHKSSVATQIKTGNDQMKENSPQCIFQCHVLGPFILEEKQEDE